MENEIKLGIGIPTVNRYDLLKESLENLIIQSEEFERLIIVDNGNQHIKITHDKVDIIENPKNKGVAGSWNQIINILVDNYQVTHVLMLNDDVVLHENQLKTIKDQIRKYPDKWMLIGDLGWAVWVIDISCLEQIEYEDKKYFDEKFFPAYYEDNDFHRRIELLQEGKCIALHEVGPKIRRGSMTIQKDSGILKGSNNGEYYARKWGGLPGKEKFKMPFNQPIMTPRIKKMKELFVLYGKSTNILNTIRSIKEIYSSPRIILFPSDQEDIIKHINFDSAYGVEVINLPENVYMSTAISKALDHFKKEEYCYLFNEYVILKKRLEMIKASEISSLCNFGPGFDDTHQREWIKTQMKEHCPSLDVTSGLNENKWNGVYGSMFGCHKSILEKIKETGFMNIIPTGVNESQAMERGWGILFELLDLDHVTSSVCGDFFQFLKNPENDYLKLKITGNGGE